MSDFLMPSLGADMEEATVVEWQKNVGDTVKRGDVLAVVETVKGAIEVETFEDGVLEDIVAFPGATVAVGEVLAHLENWKATSSRKQTILVEEEAKKAPPDVQSGTTTKDEIHISPAARKRAKELGIDVESVPVGSDGVIGLSEIEAVATALESIEIPSSTKGKPGLNFDAMRKAIGAAMARSKREVPHYYVSSTLDVSPFVEWLKNKNAERSVADRILYAAPLLKAVAIAVKQVSALNGFFEDDAYEPSEHVNVGLATAMRGGGLIAPAIHDADALTTDKAMAQLRDVVTRVRSGRLRGSEMTDSTITLSILGEGTADSLFPIIYPPQVAIIGCGAIRDRPWIVDEAILSRKTMTVTVAGDHRVSDGRTAGHFLKHLDGMLREPDTL